MEWPALTGSKIGALATSLSLFGKQRIGRLAYTRNSAIAVAVAVLPGAILFAIDLAIAQLVGEESWAHFLNASHLAVLLVIIIVFFFGLGLVIHYFAVYQRYHDLNKGGYFLVMTIVPFANIYYWFKLLFGKAVNEGNGYGDPPLAVAHPRWIIVSFSVAVIVVVLLRLIIAFGTSNSP